MEKQYNTKILRTKERGDKKSRKFVDVTYMEANLGDWLNEKSAVGEQQTTYFSDTELSIPLPPHGETAIGRAEDSVQNCLRLRPRAPRKDLNKFLQYSGKVGNRTRDS